MKKFTVRENSTLKKFTDATYPQGSFALNVLLKKGDIRVNGVKVRADCPVTAGEEVVYYTTPAQEGKRSHTVVYEDENILVCDKESGVSSEALFCEIEESGARFPVHRLDRNTVGLIAVAKSEEAQNILIDAFKNRAVDKVYFCLAKNNFKRTAATLTAYLSKDAVQGVRRRQIRRLCAQQKISRNPPASRRERANVSFKRQMGILKRLKIRKPTFYLADWRNKLTRVSP